MRGGCGGRWHERQRAVHGIDVPVPSCCESHWPEHGSVPAGLHCQYGSAAHCKLAQTPSHMPKQGAYNACTMAPSASVTLCVSVPVLERIELCELGPPCPIRAVKDIWTVHERIELCEIEPICCARDACVMMLLLLPCVMVPSAVSSVPVSWFSVPLSRYAHQCLYSIALSSVSLNQHVVLVLPV